MSLKRIIFGVIIGLLIVLQISLVRAETIPATSTPGTPQAGYMTSPYGKVGLTQADACKWVVVNGTGVFYNGACYHPTNGWAASVNPWSGCVGAQGASIACATVYSCPANAGWTLSGANCTRTECQAGYDRNAQGICQKDCTAKQGQAAGTGGGSFDFPNDGSSNTVSGCTVTCSTSVSSGGIVPLYETKSGCTYTGASPSDPANNSDPVEFKPDAKTPTKPSDCTGSGMGYVQGSTGTVTCMPPSDAPPENRPKVEQGKTSESGKTGTDGKPDFASPDYKKTDSKTTTDGEKTTTEEKTTSNPDTAKNGTSNNGCEAGATFADGKCTTTKTTVESTSDFCTKNPLATACKGYKDECIENPDRASCTNMGTPSDAQGDLQTKAVGVSGITVVNFASNDTCPPDQTFAYGVVISWQPACNALGWLKPLVLSLAWLSAGMFVIGALRT